MYFLSCSLLRVTICVIITVSQSKDATVFWKLELHERQRQVADTLHLLVEITRGQAATQANDRVIFSGGREGRGGHIWKGLGVRVNCRLYWYGWVLSRRFGREVCRRSLQTLTIFKTRDLILLPWRPFLESLDSLDPKIKRFYVYRVCIQDQSFNNFENDSMKLSVKEEKLTGLWARLTVLLYIQYLVSKFAFRPEKLPGLSRNGRLIRMVCTQGKISFQTNIMELDSFWEKRMLVHKCRPLIGSLHTLLKDSGPKWHPV